MFNKHLMITTTLLAASLALAKNDWAVPCTSGACSYDTGDGVNTAWASISLNGPTAALSDITTAAGWTISGCSATWASGAADIQIACSGTPEQMARCAHLFAGGSALNKIVRLPENCGTGPFARVVSTTQVSPGVHAATIDYDFAKITDAGAVSFSASASNVRASPKQRRRAYPISRRFDLSRTVDLPPIRVAQTFNLFNQSIACPAPDGAVGFDASLGVDVGVDVDARVAFGVTVEGSVLPLPKIDKFQLTGTLTGSAGADFTIDAAATGTFDTGLIPLFQAGLPGLSFPGILELGPQFVLNAQLEAELGLQATIKAGASAQFDEVQLVFPPESGLSMAHAMPAHAPSLTLSLEPDVKADGALTAHLIPRVEVGIDVLGGLAEASIFLDLDTSATLRVSTEASAVVSNNKAANVPPSLSGCAQLDAGLDITAGARGALPPFFDKEVEFPIFQTDATLFKQCFGAGGAKRRRSATGRFAALEGGKKRSATGRFAALEGGKRDVVPVGVLSKRQLACPGA
ncbi:hypothetical protein AURDEDRAFT_153822 [Auricularia subglabra TFB-10046 SS5]|nr:hypothetical protein AURDEDRAFT_153822 [Auricularia subglabra TFB-10046 SS5]